MQIADDRVGRRLKELDQIVDRPAKHLDAQHAVQVAHVSAHHDLRCRGPLAPGYCSRSFRCASPSSSATVFFRCPPTARIVGASPRVDMQLDRQRSESAGTAKRLRAVGADANDRIVDGPHDRPIVGQQHVGNRAKPPLGVLDASWPSALPRDCRWCIPTAARPPPSANGATAYREASLPSTDCREQRR